MLVRRVVTTPFPTDWDIEATVTRRRIRRQLSRAADTVDVRLGAIWTHPGRVQIAFKSRSQGVREFWARPGRVQVASNTVAQTELHARADPAAATESRCNACDFEMQSAGGQGRLECCNSYRAHLPLSNLLPPRPPPHDRHSHCLGGLGECAVQGHHLRTRHAE
eukprot:9478390-Pyramimonas_sp.AAC.1